MQTRLELYQLVAPLTGLGIWERNLTSGATYWNDIIHQILEVDPGYVPDPESSLRFYKAPEDVTRLLTQLIETHQPQQAELELVTGKGTTKWVRVRMNIRENQDSDRLVYGTLEDITAQAELRAALEEREQRFTNAFSYAPIGIALVSLSGKWVKVNKSICSLLGFEEDELMDLTFQEITHPDDLRADLDRLNQLIDGKIDRYSMEKRYFHKDGHTIWALLNVSLVRSENGLPLYFISQIKDITERRKNAEVIKNQNARLLNFAHIISHNLRSHAGNIRMLSSMAENEEDHTERSMQLGMLNENAENLLETLAQLNEIVKIHNKGRDDRKYLYLLKEIQRTVQILSASIIQEKVRVDIDVAPDMAVLFNPAYLESVFINLLTNSIRYRDPDREPRIKIAARQSFDKIIVTFADNGMGIDMALHGHKLFGMHKTFHGNADARGMGLFLVKNQIEAMDGSISAKSVPHEGMTFTIEIEKP